MRSPVDIKKREALLKYIDNLRNLLVPEPITKLEFEENYHTRFAIKMAEHDLVELGK